MKFLPIILLSLVFTNGFSISKIDSLNLYYNNIINAEASLMTDSFSKANTYYSKAFKYKKYPFGKDLKNSILSELFSSKRKEVLSEKFVFFLNVSGLLINEIKYAEKRKGFGRIEIFPNEFKNSIDWEYVNNNKLNYSLDTNLISQFVEIKKRDQNLRKECFNKYGGNFYVECGDAIRKKDSINFFKLLYIINNYNVEERIIGQKMSTMYLIVQHSFDVYGDVLLVKLKDLVFQGKYDARIYAMLKDDYAYLDKANKYQNGKYFGTGLGGVYGKYYLVFLSLTEERTVDINKNRATIFLDDYLSEQKRLAWFSKYDNWFSPSRNIIIHSKSDERVESIRKKNNVLVFSR